MMRPSPITRQAVSELIARDINRTCVIAWSLSNEPGYLAEPEYRERSGPYWKELFAHARALDASRPMTHANVGYAGNDDPAFDEADIVTINRYHGWYSEPGQLANARAALEADFEVLDQASASRSSSPNSAPTQWPGQHATYDQMFTEEYQARFIETYWEAISAHPSVIGGHVWNFRRFPHRAAWAARGAQSEGRIHPHPRAQNGSVAVARIVGATMTADAVAAVVKARLGIGRFWLQHFLAGAQPVDAAILHRCAWPQRRGGGHGIPDRQPVGRICRHRHRRNCRPDADTLGQLPALSDLCLAGAGGGVHAVLLHARMAATRACFSTRCSARFSCAPLIRSSQSLIPRYRRASRRMPMNARAWRGGE